MATMYATHAICVGVGLAICAFATQTNAMSLKEAVSTALTSNPEILEASKNREAVEFELRQARGRYLPTLDLEGNAGLRRLDSPGRRNLNGNLGTSNQTLREKGASLTLRQNLFTAGARKADVHSQAARVDGASFRVAERSEAVALRVAQNYFEVLLQQEIIRLAKANASVLSGIVRDIRSLVGSTLTVSDMTQGRERLLAARADVKRAQEEYHTANAEFRKLVGVPLISPRFPKSLRHSVPSTLSAAISEARASNPSISAGLADIESADARVRETRSTFLPNVDLEARGLFGDDINGTNGVTRDAQVQVVARWNLFRGGRDVARRQELIRRADEQRARLTLAHRETERSVRTAWARRSKQGELSAILKQQAATSARLVSSYRSQLRLGERSLLDVLSAQNSRFQTAVDAKIAAYAAAFGNYQVLAAIGTLNSALNLQRPAQAEDYARKDFKVPESEPELPVKRLPSKQKPGDPIDLLAPLFKK